MSRITKLAGMFGGSKRGTHVSSKAERSMTLDRTTTTRPEEVSSEESVAARAPTVVTTAPSPTLIKTTSPVVQEVPPPAVDEATKNRLEAVNLRLGASLTTLLGKKLISEAEFNEISDSMLAQISSKEVLNQRLEAVQQRLGVSLSTLLQQNAISKDEYHAISGFMPFAQV